MSHMWEDHAVFHYLSLSYLTQNNFTSATHFPIHFMVSFLITEENYIVYIYHLLVIYKRKEPCYVVSVLKSYYCTRVYWPVNHIDDYGLERWLCIKVLCNVLEINQEIQPIIPWTYQESWHVTMSWSTVAHRGMRWMILSFASVFVNNQIIFLVDLAYCHHQRSQRALCLFDLVLKKTNNLLLHVWLRPWEADVDPTHPSSHLGRTSYRLFPGGPVNLHGNLYFIIKVLTLMMGTCYSLPNMEVPTFT